MAKGQSPSPGKRVGGVVLMLLGAALIGYGTHFLAKNGNCSSTGYVSYGPVPKCSGAEALYITSTFFLGPALAVVGWLMAQAWGVLWPAVCISVGIGLVTLGADTAAASGARSFGLAGGLVFFALAVLSVIVTVRKRLRRKPVPAGLAGLRPGSGGLATAHVAVVPAAHPPPPAGPQPAGPDPAGPQPAGPPSPDPLDRIAKLAQLRDSGALTSEEYEAQKARLLAQM